MIRHFIKIFLTSIILISVLLCVTSLGYITLIDKNIVIGTIKGIEDNNEEKNINLSETYNYDTEFGKKIKESKRINFLVVGLENQRTDTILVASYDTENKEADIISIPRDTYYPRNANDRPETKKINAVYAIEGIDGLKGMVEKLLGIPIDKYVVLNYEAVIACVDLLGGVEVNVPFHMEYSDPYDDPPLIIDIPEGIQTLNGEQALKFLRYRKGYANQDLGRIEAQQQFIKSAAKKAFGLKLPELIREAYSYIDTNIETKDLIGWAVNMVGFSEENINLYLLPGTEAPLEGLSFFIPNKNEIENLVYTIYDMPNTENN